jgi:hypothetical protein
MGKSFLLYRIIIIPELLLMLTAYVLQAHCLQQLDKQRL